MSQFSNNEEKVKQRDHAVHRYVLGYFGTAACDQALAFTLSLMNHQTDFINVVAFIEFQKYQDVDIQMQPEEVVDSIRAKLLDLEGDLEEEGIAHVVELAEVFCPPGEALVEFVDQVTADYLVVGSSTHEGLAKWFSASTADYVLEHASCPVLFVKTKKQIIALKEDLVHVSSLGKEEGKEKK
eukprot:TRINITY_DN1182_c0_g3_i1.p1 TRINITY_DN1182_c0_g3~~TRINITY_DN1182_c0_g3_i1.p1  ORF type:complete len:183 (-),score=58.10 TRINITY_DN1182_c0_g3_i1:225-773(-)